MFQTRKKFTSLITFPNQNFSILTKDYFNKLNFLKKKSILNNNFDTQIIMKKEFLNNLNVNKFSSLKKYNNRFTIKRFANRQFILKLIGNSIINKFNKIPKACFSNTTYGAEEEILLTEAEALLMNEHDRICILLTNNSIAKENIINFINELLNICIQLNKFSIYMQGWEILVKFISQNLTNFNNTDFIKFIDGLGHVNLPNESFWNNVANNLLTRDLAPEKFVKVLFIITINKQEKRFYEKLIEKVKDYNLFCESKAENKENVEGFEISANLNFSNSLVLLNILSQNLINENFYNKDNLNIKNFVDDYIVKKTLAILVTKNILDKISKKDIIILLRICGNIFNCKALKDSISHQPFDNFIQEIILFINKLKADPKNINLVITVFLMIKNIDYLIEKNLKIFENLILVISENYKAANDLLKYSFYLEFLDICSNHQILYKILLEKSVPVANTNEDFYRINYLIIPNEEFLKEYTNLKENLRKESSPLDFAQIKRKFFIKHHREIGISKESSDQHAKNNYAIVNNLNYIFG